MVREKILITVKTYPTLSSKYDETVCTAGLREDGSWIRIYPIPFRKLDEFEQYKKFQWVEVDVEPSKNDSRPESHKKCSNIEIVGELDTKKYGWQARNQIVLEKGKVYTNFQSLLEDNNSERKVSLATFKPAEIFDLEIEEEESRDWDPKKILEIEARAKQDDLFDDAPKYFKLTKKLPYKFRYRFSDETGKERKIIITDWEIGSLFWRQLRRHNGDEQAAIHDVYKKYMKTLVVQRDTHFFLGTTLKWDNMNAPNPFTIIGVYWPPEEPQGALFV